MGRRLIIVVIEAHLNQGFKIVQCKKTKLLRQFVALSSA
ncbi:hypothetical protein GP5015_950 [gamma proteobacterium HTCC5015]|nr:hypothetical protein GP5015_950 [gamma proteobacterium HTCC5015]